MKKLAYFLKLIPVVVVFSVSFLFAPVDYACAKPIEGGQASAGNPEGGQASAGNPEGGQASTIRMQTVSLDNPLKFNSLQELVVAILNIFTTLMIPVIVFFIIYSGFKYVTAQGNPGQIEEASTMLTYAIIGGVLILAAVAIAEIIKNTVASFTP